MGDSGVALNESLQSYVCTYPIALNAQIVSSKFTVQCHGGCVWKTMKFKLQSCNIFNMGWVIAICTNPSWNIFMGWGHGNTGTRYTLCTIFWYLLFVPYFGTEGECW